MSVSLTGRDVTIIDGRILKDFGPGDVVTVEFPNDLANGQTGKDGNTVIAQNSTGRNADVMIRLLKGSADDKYLNSRLTEFTNDPPSFSLLSGEFVKRIGTDSGVVEDIYNLSNGIFVKIPGSKENVEGDIDQAITEYSLRFFAAKRTI